MGNWAVQGNTTGHVNCHGLKPCFQINGILRFIYSYINSEVCLAYLMYSNVIYSIMKLNKAKLIFICHILFSE